MLAVFISSSTIAFGANGDKKLMGEIIVSGNGGNGDNPAVMFNGERALSGHTFFSSGQISTSKTGSATVELGKLGHINLSPNSILSLNFTENSISGTLSSGQIKVFSKEGVSVNIQTVDGIINNDANQNGIYTIDVQSGSTKTLAEQGTVSLNNGKTNVPQQKKDDDDDDKAGALWIPVAVFSGIVGVAAIYVLTRGDDDSVTSPVR
jgi:hypothetical protein